MTDPAPPAKPIAKAKVAALPATVILLGTVSLFTDFSSEMVYPLLPLYLSVVLGAGAVSLGLIEGLAESTAALLKVASGVISDRTRRRKPLVVLGYTLSNAVRPLIGLAGAWPQVLGLRVADRLGKGLRTSPRDALIADVTGPEQRGHAYGLHRAMDHAGAVLGPLAALALLSGLGWSLRAVFLASALPGAVVVVLVLGVLREPRPAPAAAGGSESTAPGWSELGTGYRRFLLALVVFTLGNSTDAFLLLQLSRAGYSPGWVSGLWALHHVVKMGGVYAVGRLSDRVSRRGLMLIGWGIYSAIYAGFAATDDPRALLALFLAYGLYFAFTEPVERGWVAALAPGGLRGSAFGAYHGAIGLTALPASLLFGLLLDGFGAAAAFGAGAALAGVAALLLLRVPPPPASAA